MESSQDHKPIGDGDTGPNTGGMGAYSPAPVVTEALMDKITSEILVPVVDGMNRNNTPYKGVLYAGIMITAGGPRVLEFNVRFGDPETQPILMRLKSDLLEVLPAVCDGTLDKVILEWDRRPAVCVVMASGGYPGAYEKGKKITGLDEAERLNRGCCCLSRRHCCQKWRYCYRRRQSAGRNSPGRKNPGCKGKGLRGHRQNKIRRRLLPPGHCRQGDKKA